MLELTSNQAIIDQKPHHLSNNLSAINAEIDDLEENLNFTQNNVDDRFRKLNQKRNTRRKRFYQSSKITSLYRHCNWHRKDAGCKCTLKIELKKKQILVIPKITENAFEWCECISNVFSTLSNIYDGKSP